MAFWFDAIVDGFGRAIDGLKALPVAGNISVWQVVCVGLVLGLVLTGIPLIKVSGFGDNSKPDKPRPNDLVSARREQQKRYR